MLGAPSAQAEPTGGKLSNLLTEPFVRPGAVQNDRPVSIIALHLFPSSALFSLVIFAAPHHLTPSSAVYWFFMQIGMTIGFFSTVTRSRRTLGASRLRMP